jgi:hypothetical protein
VWRQYFDLPWWAIGFLYGVIALTTYSWLQFRRARRAGMRDRAVHDELLLQTGVAFCAALVLTPVRLWWLRPAWGRLALASALAAATSRLWYRDVRGLTNPCS